MELESMSLVFVYLSSLSIPQRPVHKKKETVSALKYIGWNETQENSASFSLSDLMLFSKHEATL